MKYTFGQFELDRDRRQLFKDGEAIAINSKAFDLLCELVAAGGSVVTKERLLDAVWPDQFVEENNLTVQISALRKALGGDTRMIATVPGKGYCFVVDVRSGSGDDEIVVEERTISRIVIEESYDEPVPDEQIRRLNGDTRGRYAGPFTITFAVLALTLGVLGLFYVKSGTNADSSEWRLSKITSSGDVTAATITSDGKYAVFGRKEKDGESLWIRQIASGSQQQVLASRPVQFVGLAVSPDGSSIYATIFSPVLADTGVWRLPLLGGVVEELRGVTTGASVSFSPDAKRIAFTESRSTLKETQLLISNIDGSEKRIVSRAADNTRSFPNFDANPVAWSPDGGSIACSVEETASGTKHGILLVDPQDGSERFISDKRWDYVDQLVWIDNDTLAFVEYSIDPSIGQIRSVSRSTGEVKRITNDLSSYSWLARSGDALLAVQSNTRSRIAVADYDDASDVLVPREIFNESGSIGAVAFASDGSIVFGSNSSGKREIWRIDANGSGARQLTVNANVTFGLTASPLDGTLVFSSTENGKSFLKQIKLDGSGLRQLTDGPEDVNPTFAPDGRSVVHQKGIYNKVITLWRFTLDTETIAPLVETYSSRPTISRDGTQLAYYFMDHADGGQWKIGLASAIDGSALGKLAFPRPVTERLMSWHPDGKSICQVIYDGGEIKLMLIPTSGGSPRIIGGLGKGSVNRFDWSVDGKHLVFALSDQQHDIIRFSR